MVTMTLHPIASRRRPLDVPITAVSRRWAVAHRRALWQAAAHRRARWQAAAPRRAEACPATSAAAARDREPSAARARAADHSRAGPVHRRSGPYTPTPQADPWQEAAV